MQVFFTERLQQWLPVYRQFIRDSVIPSEMDWLHMPLDQLWPLLESKRAEAKNLGLWAPYLPPSAGGLGLSMVEFAQVSELMALTPLGHYIFNCQAPDIGNIELLHLHATPAQKASYLQPLMEGKIRSCFSMTEPDRAGSNPVLMDTTAKREGDGYVINGRKWFTTGADGSAFAVVMAITNPDAEPHKRASMLMVPTGTPGFKLLRNIPIMGESGGGWLSHGEIEYRDCRVPLSALLGPEGEGFRLAQERLGPGRIHHCMRWIGIAERSLELMMERALQRDMGDGTSLADKQTIQSWIAESRAAINAARWMVLHTALKLDSEGAKAAREDISLIKFHVAGMLGTVLDRAIQVQGARGLTEETPLSFWYRHERAARIYDGPDEVHKVSVARSLLRKFQQQQKS
jgi:alkylation response protein AidB-like acyl-CoA dehydrogenase